MRIRVVRPLDILIRATDGCPSRSSALDPLTDLPKTRKRHPIKQQRAERAWPEP